MPTNDDCPVCNGRKIIITRDYADCEREEPCSHCSEHEHCASCLTLRAENARLRELVEDVVALLKTAPEFIDELTAALKEPGV
jgi:hypothetical protein